MTSVGMVRTKKLSFKGNRDAYVIEYLFPNWIIERMRYSVNIFFHTKYFRLDDISVLT